MADLPIRPSKTGANSFKPILRPSSRLSRAWRARLFLDHGQRACAGSGQILPQIAQPVGGRCWRAKSQRPAAAQNYRLSGAWPGFNKQESGPQKWAPTWTWRTWHLTSLFCFKVGHCIELMWVVWCDLCGIPMRPRFEIFTEEVVCAKLSSRA